jgi:hypothetical protein
MHNLFAISTEAVIRAARARIELKATPESRISEWDEKGHYLWLERDLAQIIAVDDHRPAAGTYNDLLPGYRLIEVAQLPLTGEPDATNKNKSFVSIKYVRDPVTALD